MERKMWPTNLQLKKGISNSYKPVAFSLFLLRFLFLEMHDTILPFSSAEEAVKGKEVSPLTASSLQPMQPGVNL